MFGTATVILVHTIRHEPIEQRQSGAIHGRSGDVVPFLRNVISVPNLGIHTTYNVRTRLDYIQIWLRHDTALALARAMFKIIESVISRTEVGRPQIRIAVESVTPL